MEITNDIINPSMEKYKYKRLFDIVFILCIWLFGFPILLLFIILISLCIWTTDRGSILYLQTRVSKNGNEFKIIKFRTMVVDAEKYSGPCLVNITDYRITRIGRVLRKTRFDELPQMINILRGEMSIVGPRPERPELIEVIKQTVPCYDDRLKILPGITGIAQVYGKDSSDFKAKLKYDRIYMRNMCLFLDIKLIILSILKVLNIKYMFN